MYGGALTNKPHYRPRPDGASWTVRKTFLEPQVRSIFRHLDFPSLSHHSPADFVGRVRRGVAFSGVDAGP